jgi:hypothetical protein
MKPFTVCLLVGLISLGCIGNSGAQTPAITPRVYAVRDTPVLISFYVVHDDEGHSGYFCLDGRHEDIKPRKGDPLFQSLADLRNAIHTLGLDYISVIPTFDSAPPDGWEIRNLTKDEEAFLSAPRRTLARLIIGGLVLAVISAFFLIRMCIRRVRERQASQTTV